MARNLTDLPLNDDPQDTDWLLGASGISPAVFQKIPVGLVKAAKQKGALGVNIVAPTNGTRLLLTFPFPATVISFNDLKTTAGTCVIALNLNGTAITPISAVTVNSTPQDVTATASNTGLAGQRLELVVSSSTGAANLTGTIYLETEP